MKMKEFGPRGGGRASLAPPLRSANDPHYIYRKGTKIVHWCSKKGSRFSHLQLEMLSVSRHNVLRWHSSGKTGLNTTIRVRD